MQIGRVARKSKTKTVKDFVTKPVKIIKDYRSTKVKKLIMVLFLFAISFFSLVNVKAVIKDSFNNYYVNADVNNPDIKPPVISTEQSGDKVSDIFSSNSNASFVDKRVYVLDRYFESNNSPLAGYGKTFVEACDKYGAPKECVTVVAIAYNETHLCKYPGSKEMYNCWGFGGGGVYRMAFNSFEEAIDRVTRVLVQQYGLKYMDDPSLMEGTFCGNEEGCTGWGHDIKYFMRDLRNYSASLGVDMAN